MITQINPKFADKIFTREFIYEELTKSVEDGTLPGVTARRNFCRYLTPDGKKCAVGNFIQGSTSSMPLFDLLAKCPELEKTLTNGGITVQKWMSIQGAHGYFALTCPEWDGPKFLAKLKEILGPSTEPF